MSKQKDHPAAEADKPVLPPPVALVEPEYLARRERMILATALSQASKQCLWEELGRRDPLLRDLLRRELQALRQMVPPGGDRGGSARGLEVRVLFRDPSVHEAVLSSIERIEALADSPPRAVASG